MPELTDTQRRVLVALCRPYRDGGRFASPATNQQIADEVFLSVDAVKMHLRTLFGKFELGDLPQNEKRARLAECVLQFGLISRAISPERGGSVRDRRRRVRQRRSTVDRPMPSGVSAAAGSTPSACAQARARSAAVSKRRAGSLAMPRAITSSIARRRGPAAARSGRAATR